MINCAALLDFPNQMDQTLIVKSHVAGIMTPLLLSLLQCKLQRELWIKIALTQMNCEVHTTTITMTVENNIIWIAFRVILSMIEPFHQLPTQLERAACPLFTDHYRSPVWTRCYSYSFWCGAPLSQWEKVLLGPITSHDKPGSCHTTVCPPRKLASEPSSNPGVPFLIIQTSLPTWLHASERTVTWHRPMWDWMTDRRHVNRMLANKLQSNNVAISNVYVFGPLAPTWHILTTKLSYS